MTYFLTSQKMDITYHTLTSIGHNKNVATFGYSTTISIQRFDFTALIAALPVSPDVPTE